MTKPRLENPPIESQVSGYLADAESALQRAFGRAKKRICCNLLSEQVDGAKKIAEMSNGFLEECSREF